MNIREDNGDVHSDSRYYKGALIADIARLAGLDDLRMALTFWPSRKPRNQNVGGVPRLVDPICITGICSNSLGSRRLIEWHCDEDLPRRPAPPCKHKAKGLNVSPFD